MVRNKILFKNAKRISSQMLLQQSNTIKIVLNEISW